MISLNQLAVDPYLSGHGWFEKKADGAILASASHRFVLATNITIAN